MHLIVREHERIAVVQARSSDAERALTVEESEALLRVCERARIPAVVGGYRSVKFGSHCGVVQAGSLLVEILPKIADVAADADDYDRGALLRMIALASDFPLASLDADKLGLQRHSILLALVRWFCDELFKQFHQGLLREYVEQADALPLIRGRWRPDVDALRHAGRPDRMQCEFDELTADNRYNHVLKAALRRVQVLARGSEGLSRKISELLGWLGEVCDPPVTIQQAERLASNRLTRRYDRALMMARWFLAAESPDLKRGAQQGIALLFNMNALFQRVLGESVRRVLPDDLRLREEGPRRYLATDHLNEERFQLRPDLCILREQEVVAIIDAKWKRLDPAASAGGWKLSPADVYQLHAYSVAYKCRDVALWYPQALGALPPEVQPKFKFDHSGLSDSHSSLRVDWIRTAFLGSSKEWRKGLFLNVAQGLQRLGVEANWSEVDKVACPDGAWQQALESA